MAASVDGSRVYIANSGANTVSVINASTNTILTKIPVQNDPGGIAITPDGKLVYVVNSGSNTISVINTATNTVIANVSDPSGPWCVVVSPDGSTVYVTDIHSNKVEVINTATNTIVNTITVGKNPYYLSISADGKNLYVANSGENSISLINTISKAVSTITVAASPQVVCLSPDGSRLYVQHLRSPLIEIINTADNTILSSITMPSNVLGMSVSSDGNWLYAANGNIVSALNVSNYSLITIPVGTDAVAVGNFISAGPGCSGTCYVLYYGKSKSHHYLRRYFTGINYNLWKSFTIGKFYCSRNYAVGRYFSYSSHRI